MNIIICISECASASTAAPSCIAWCLLRLLSRRWMEYAACDFAFGKVLCISFLLVLCKFFAFLVSCLLVLCKFSASSLQVSCVVSCEVSAGVQRRRRKTRESWTQNGTNMEPIWPRGSARGIRKSIEKWTNEENANANTKMIFSFLKYAAVSSKNGGLNGCAFTDVLWKKVTNMLYKIEHKETQPKQQMSQSPSNIITF